MSDTIYNATDGALVIDQAGHVLPAREHSPDEVDVTRSPVSGHIAAGRAIVVESPASSAGKAGKSTRTPSPEA